MSKRVTAPQREDAPSELVKRIDSFLATLGFDSAENTANQAGQLLMDARAALVAAAPARETADAPSEPTTDAGLVERLIADAKAYRSAYDFTPQRGVTYSQSPREMIAEADAKLEASRAALLSRLSRLEEERRP